MVCQTLVRMLGTPHAETNAAMLPRTMDAMRGRAPEEIASLAQALGVEPDEIRSRIESLGGGPRRLGDLGADRDRARGRASRRSSSGRSSRTRPIRRVGHELRRLVEAAW